MTPISVQINTNAVETELQKLEALIAKGTENGVRAASKRAGELAKNKIPVRTGQTVGKLRVTFSRRKGDFVGRIGVRAPRTHIMRFLENGTKTHGKHGGPLPARHIMADVKTIIAPQVPGFIDTAIETELNKSKL